MTTRDEIDSVYSELENGIANNNRANARYRASVEGAENRRESGRRQSEARSDTNRANADSALQNVQRALNDGQSLLRDVSISDRNLAAVQPSATDHISSQRRLEQTNQNADTALQRLRQAQEHLVDVRRYNDRTRRARQRIVTIGLGVVSLLLLGGLIVYSNISTQQATRDNQTATAVALISLNQTVGAQLQMTNEDALSRTQTALASTQKAPPSLTPFASATAIPSLTSSIDQPTRTAIPSDAFNIRPGESRQMVLDIGRKDRWTLFITNERRISIQVVSEQFGHPDAYLEIYDLTGRLLASDDDSGGNLNPHIASLSVRSSTRYTIVISSRNSSSGSYILSVDALN